MEILGFGKKNGKQNGAKPSKDQNDSLYNVPETIKVPENSLHNAVDQERYDEESNMRRGEHYNRQRRRSRYFENEFILG